LGEFWIAADQIPAVVERRARIPGIAGDAALCRDELYGSVVDELEFHGAAGVCVLNARGRHFAQLMQRAKAGAVLTSARGLPPAFEAPRPAGRCQRASSACLRNAGGWRLRPRRPERPAAAPAFSAAAAKG